MTDTQITCFLAVVKYQNFSKAADHLYVSQSAVSKNIAQLEKSVGHTLIDRSGNLVRLTPAGVLFHEYLSEMEEKRAVLKQKLAQLSPTAAANIRLGCLDGWDLSLFFPRIRDVFKERYPAISLDLEGFNHIQVLDALSAGDIDIAITLGFTLPSHGKFSSKKIATAPATMMFSASHPLANKPNLSLIDFIDEPFYVISPSKDATNPMGDLTLLLCRRAGFEPRIEYLSSSASILLKLQSGSGVLTTCSWTCAGRMPIYKSVFLDYDLDISAAWIDNGSKPIKNLLIDELMRLDIDNF